MEESSRRLFVICEGGAHTVEYLHNNGVFPGAIMLEATKFREVSPYLTKNDDVLLILKGITDFSISEIYVLIEDLEEVRHKLHNITIISNIHLGKVDATYYLYDGDLFYGGMKEVVNGKIYSIESESTATAKGKKDKRLKKEDLERLDRNSSKSSEINTVMEGYKVYNQRNVKFKIYGANKREIEPSYEKDALLSKIINVNLFPNSSEQ